MLTIKKVRTSQSSPDLDVRAKGARLAFSHRVYVMGVLNVTPDSFSDGGEFFNKEKAIERAIRMAREGADIIDIGGESTRPGAADVDLEEELRRVIPIVEAVARNVKIPISIDTRKSKVAAQALSAGASIINDISGLKHDLAMAEVVARSDAAVIVMHMKGSPGDMQLDPRYGNLIGEIIESLKRSIDIAKNAGIDNDKIIIDPGIGFGKTAEHNMEILGRLGEFKALGRPICIGTSRKSFIRKVVGSSDPDSLLAGTLATCIIAMQNGANILRVHDVSQTVSAVKMVSVI